MEDCGVNLLTANEAKTIKAARGWDRECICCGLIYIYIFFFGGGGGLKTF